MSIDFSIAIIIVLALLVLIQIGILIILKKMIIRLSSFSKIVATSKIKSSSRQIVSYKSFKTCQHCQFRLSFIKFDADDVHEFLYHCKLEDIEITLDTFCNKFELESSKTK